MAEGFVIADVKDPDRGAKKLVLPRSVRNIRVRPGGGGSNPAVVDLTRVLLVAGVRRDIFVWNLRTKQLLR